MIAAMVGREHGSAPPRAGAAAPRAVLVGARARRSTCRPGTAGGGCSTASTSTSHRGEVLGIAGLLGSGRTEILETIFGASAGRRGGDGPLDGEPVAIALPRDARRLGLALVTEDRKAKGLHLAGLDPRQRRAAVARPLRPLRRPLGRRPRRGVARRRGRAGSACAAPASSRSPRRSRAATSRRW